MNASHIPVPKILLAFLAMGTMLGVFLLGYLYAQTAVQPTHVAPSPASSSSPGMDYVEDFRCVRGEHKIILTGGFEDNYARGNPEPMRIHPRLMSSPYFQAFAQDTNSVLGARDYDERGADKGLFDYFNIPTNIASGALIIRGIPTNDITSDSIQLGQYEISSKTPWLAAHIFSANTAESKVKSIGPGGDMLFRVDLKALKASSSGGQFNSLLALLEAKGATVLDLFIQDDLIVDFSALILCQKPVQNKGTTLFETKTNLYAPELAELSCRGDLSQARCNPNAGDHACTDLVALGCYKDGDKPPPKVDDELIKAMNAYVGGEVRATPPVAAAQFKTIADANAFCTASFGPGWRTLSFHEAGGSRIISHSQIEKGSRLWIDVKNQPYANCWDNGSHAESAHE